MTKNIPLLTNLLGEGSKKTMSMIIYFIFNMIFDYLLKLGSLKMESNSSNPIEAVQIEDKNVKVLSLFRLSLELNWTLLHDNFRMHPFKNQLNHLRHPKKDQFLVSIRTNLNLDEQINKGKS